LAEKLRQAKKNVHEALADSFDTPRAVNELSSLVVAANSYMNAHVNDMKLPLVLTVSRYVLFVLKSMGVYESDDIPTDTTEGAINKEETIAPLMNVLSKFRDDVKLNAKEGPGQMFKLSD
jgi:cysteinyl-tRNA synthetase